MKKFGILVACAALAFAAVGCDDSDDTTPSGGGGSGGSGGSGGGVCGDNVIDVAAGEECDDGNTVDGDGCEADCTITPVAADCGNGVVEGAEKCDDGNTVDGDGCSADCLNTTISISGVVGLNPIAARWYFANGIATPSFANFVIRAVDPILSLAGDPNATLATATVAANGSFAFAEPVKTTGISLGMVLTVSDPAGTPAGDEILATSTMGVCQPGAAAPQPDCSANIAAFTAYVVPMDFVRALETGVGATLISDTEGFVLGGVMDTNGQPIGGASATTPAATTTFFDLNLQPITTGLTDDSTGAFLIQPSGIATLSVEKAGVNFLSSTATVGKSSGVAFQVFFLHPAPAANCGNGTVDAGEDCEPPSSATCDETCHTIVVDVCGDGTKTGPEKCDDGNTADGDACSADCMHTFISVTGTVGANPFAAGIHAAAGVAIPSTAGLQLIAIEPIARLSDPQNPAAGIVGMTQVADATGAFSMMVENTGVAIGLVVTVTDGDATTTDMWAQSTIGLCVPPCTTDIPAATVYAVTDLANGALEAGLATDLLSDTNGYILGMTLDVGGAQPAPMGGVTVTGTDPASPVLDAETFFLTPGGGAFVDNGTEMTTDGVGAFVSTHQGIAGYTATKPAVNFQMATQQASASPATIFQMFFLGH